jgi:hypothetical protein
MRRDVHLLHKAAIVAALALSVTAAAPAQTPPSTVEVIIEKSLAAYGGREALQRLTSSRAISTITYPTRKGDVTATMDVLVQAPNKSYSVARMDLSAVGRGTDVVEEWFDGTSGYTRDKVNGTIPITGSRLEHMRNTIFPTDLLDYKARGTRIFYAGQETIGGRHAFVLVMRPATGPAVKVWVDTTSYLEIRSSVKLEMPRLGEVEETHDKSDYRVVEGVKVPFADKGTSGAQSWTAVLNKVTFNVPIDPKVFVKPAGK